MAVSRVLPTAVAVALFAYPLAAASQSRPCENLREVMQSVQFPREALRLAIEGRAVVAFTIDSDGLPTDVQIASSTNAVFEQPAISAVLRLRCDKQRAGMRLSLPFVFKYLEANKSDGIRSVEFKPNRTPRLGDELLYRRQVGAASGRVRSTLIRVRASLRSDEYPTWFSYTNGAAAPPGTTPVWEFGLRLPQRACLPDVLGNSWLWNADDCQAIGLDGRWSTPTSAGSTAQCELHPDEVVAAVAGKFTTRRIACKWTAGDSKGHRSTDYWYSMDIGYMVRVRRTTVDETGAVQDIVDEDLEMLTLK